EVLFADGSVGTLHYAADAPLGPGKERFETSSPGVYAELEDYRRGRVWRGHKKARLGGGRQDKGFAAQFKFLAELARGRVEAPSPESFLLSSLATLAAARSLQSGHPETVVLAGEADHGHDSPPRQTMEAMAGNGR
ncbi:MAG TPA: hypothetical protein VH391_07655, partial [Solirubrobacterales bacterium]